MAFLQDWIFSKLQKTRLKGMHSGKDGKMGGQDQQKPKQCQDHRSPNTIIILEKSGQGEGQGEGHGPNSQGLDDEAAPASPDEPSNYPRKDASNSTSTSGSSSCVSETSSPSPIPSPEGIGRKKKRNQHHHSSHSSKRLRHASTTESDENASETSSTLEREAPDGGYGWVVVGAAFFVNFIADGISLSFGEFLKKLPGEFDASKMTSSWVGSLLSSMPLLCGPIASTLTDRYGCRNVTIVGGILASTGFFLSYFATSIHMLMLTYGIISGFGLALCSVAAVVIVAYYFETKRSFATGISVCGGGIGTFILAPLTSQLIEMYNWRVTLLFLAGIFLLLCVCGLLMKDLEWTKKSHRKKEKFLQNEHDFNTQAQQNFLAYGVFFSQEGHGLAGLNSERLCNSALCIPTFVQEQERQRRSNTQRVRYYSTNENPEVTDDLKTNATEPKHIISSIIVPTHGQAQVIMTQNETKKDKGELTLFPNEERVDPKAKSANNIDTSTRNPYHIPNFINHTHTQLMKTCSNNSSSNNNHNGNVAVVVNNDKNLSAASVNNNYSNNASATTGNNVNSNNNVIGTGVGAESLSLALQKHHDVQNYVHHTKNFGSHRHSLTYRGAVLSLKRYRLRPASSCPDIISVATPDDKTTPEWKAVLTDLYFWMRGIFAWDNLSNTRFLLFVISNFLLYTWYDIPYYFLSDSATEVGYSDKQGSMLGGTIGLCNVFGNLILGYIGDRKWANSVTIYGICISICGIVTGLMPFCFSSNNSLNYYQLCILCGIFGIMIAANYSLTSVILVKVVSLEKFANAYGLLLLVQGIGNLIGPPMAGALYDHTKSWNWSFWVAGGGILISNIFILAPIYKRHENAEKSDSSRSGSASIGKGDSTA